MGVCSLHGSPGCRAYYQQRRALGDGHNQALLSLANRLVAFLHGCLSTRLYDEEIAWGGLGTEDAELAEVPERLGRHRPHPGSGAP